MTRTALETIQIGKGWFPEESGGLDRYYFELLEHLPRGGVAVHGLVTGSPQVAEHSRGTVAAFAPSRAPLRARWAGVRHQAAQLFARHPASLCVGHFALYTLPCLGLLRDRPLVVHFQGPWAAESRAEGEGSVRVRIKAWLERMVYRRATRFVVLSEAFRDLLVRQYAVDPALVDVIPGAIDARRWFPQMSKEDARRDLGWPTDRPVILVVRRLVHRMGLEDLIASVAMVRRSVPDALILIAGNGPLRGELEARSREAGVEESVRLLGFVPDADLAVAYRAADLTLVPSVALEGFGLVVAESLASGTPVLVSRVGGLPEVVRGLPGDPFLHGGGPHAIAEAMSEALLGRRALPDASECITHARARFDWPVVIGRVTDTYQRALQ